MTAALDGVAEALTVRPGDTLIVRVDRITSRDQVEEMSRQLRELFPDIRVVVIAAEQLAAERPDAAATGG